MKNVRDIVVHRRFGVTINRPTTRRPVQNKREGLAGSVRNRGIGQNGPKFSQVGPFSALSALMSTSNCSFYILLRSTKWSN